MKNNISILLLGFCLIVAGLSISKFSTLQPVFSYVPFDQSMQLALHQHILQQPMHQFMYATLKNNYESIQQQPISNNASVRIPTVIHIMWLGGKLPQEYESYVQSWRTYHPDWTIVFWTDSSLNYDRAQHVITSFDGLQTYLKNHQHDKDVIVEVKDLTFNNRSFYDRAVNYGEKSDILKWEIVYRFGGLYVDTDFECLQSLDTYHRLYDFYTGIQPLDTNRVQLGAALYGAIPYHPILKGCVEGIKNNQHIQPIVVKTGPIHFTKVFISLVGKTGLRDIAFPASYFYPCGYEERGTAQELWCKNESYAVHHWAGSWLKPEAFVKA